MRIAFDGHRLAGQRLGVGRYIEYLLSYWSGMLERDQTVTLFLRRPLVGEALDRLNLSDSIRPVVLKPDMSGIPWENICLRLPAKKHDVLFCPAYTAPVYYSGKYVVATHSVNEIQNSAHSWRYRQTYARLYKHAARHADMVIVPAEATAADLAGTYGVSAKRIVIIPQGADDSFHPLDDESVLVAARERFFGTNRPYILFVGKCSQRRNIPMLLEAFAEVRRRKQLPHGLVLFGPNVAGFPLAELCAQHGITDAVVQTDGRITNHQELVAIYNAAEVFVHPSEYEGWSMTTIEALACGTAVIASNRGALGEVTAGHALMIDDPSAAAFADALGEVLTNDAVRRDLEIRARARGVQLTWRDTSRRTLDVLRDVARS
jgi:glycosyltransferase involved in cell wall biosynthesis